jgi:hypothetical protein
MLRGGQLAKDGGVVLEMLEVPERPAVLHELQPEAQGFDFGSEMDGGVTYHALVELYRAMSFEEWEAGLADVLRRATRTLEVDLWSLRREIAGLHDRLSEAEAEAVRLSSDRAGQTARLMSVYLSASWRLSAHGIGQPRVGQRAQPTVERGCGWTLTSTDGLKELPRDPVRCLRGGPVHGTRG